jgi:hypothetical protein
LYYYPTQKRLHRIDHAAVRPIGSADNLLHHLALRVDDVRLRILEGTVIGANLGIGIAGGHEGNMAARKEVTIEFGVLVHADAQHHHAGARHVFRELIE